MIMLINFIIFAIITISQFKGRFFYCTSNLGLSMVDSHSFDYKWDCLNAGEEWVNSYYNFDNIYQALATLFVVANGSSWEAYMFQAAMATEIDQAPYMWNHQYWNYFFIGFMVIGNFFFLNLFVGVVISSFNKEKDVLGGLDKLTDLQKDWAKTHIETLKCKPLYVPKVPNYWLGRICHKLTYSGWLDKYSYCTTILNMIFLIFVWGG